MPVTTAKTRMRTPEVMTWPSTGSAMNEVPRQRAKGTRMKPFSVVSLNSMTARKSMIASTKNAISVTTQREGHQHDLAQIPEHLREAGEALDLGQQYISALHASLRKFTGT